MILRDGLRTFEFLERREIRFGSTEDALNWLKHLGAPDSDLISRFRELLSHYAGDPDTSRLTDDQVVEKLAVVLYSRRILVICRDNPASSGQPAQKAASPPLAFPLSERSSSPPSSSPQPASDPSTFGPDCSAAQQAAGLVNAAATGSPFCAECAVPKNVSNLVELVLEWPLHLVDRLPDDFTLTLSGSDLPKQDRTKSQGSSDDEWVRFEFEWEDKTKGVQLEASGNGQTVVLWREQVAGNLGADIEWNERLYPLLKQDEEEPAEAANDSDDPKPDDHEPDAPDAQPEEVN